MGTDNSMMQLREVAERIREMREILGYSEEDMARETEISVEEYRSYENGEKDMPFTFIHKCTLVFNIELTELLEGSNAARLSTYTLTRKGEGQQTAKEDGIDIRNLAPMFKKKLSEPYFVRYEYSEELQSKPIHTVTHKGQEFDYVISGSMIVQIGNNREVLNEGDTIYYNSALPHGMIATGGKDVTFLAVVLPEEETQEEVIRKTVAAGAHKSEKKLLAEKYVQCTEDENGVLESVTFSNTESFNFGFDVVDAIADKYPDKLAMIHLDVDKNERRFTFEDIKRESNRCANYFTSLGIKRGDRIMLIMKRHYQFWFAMVALHKIGAIAVPATYQLKEHDLEYRFNSAGIKGIICTADGETSDCVDNVLDKCPSVELKIIVHGKKEGWRNFDKEYKLYSSVYKRTEKTPCGDDIAFMFFSSGTSGNPKMIAHKHTYGLGHFTTARYWHCCEPDGLHYTISDTGWGKALWGKLFGQWMCEGAIFVYDFDKFNAQDLLPLFAEYKITTFCAPPTMLRMLIREDISKYDFSSIKHMTTAGEALNPEVSKIFYRATGLEIHEGFGQTETTLTIGNFAGMSLKTGSMGKANPQYKIDIVDADDKPVSAGEVGEVVIHMEDGEPIGLFKEYVSDPELNKESRRNNIYHTGDTAWRDEEGYFFYVGRADDVIKSSGYRIGPFEIESVIMELPFVLECGVSAAPDEVRGQIVKASIVLTKGTEPSEDLKKKIQNYVKAHTAPYKYPRMVVFRDELPKSVSGKIQRNKL